MDTPGPNYYNTSHPSWIKPVWKPAPIVCFCQKSGEYCGKCGKLLKGDYHKGNDGFLVFELNGLVRSEVVLWNLGATPATSKSARRK